MKSLIYLIITAAVLTSCATVEFYDDPELQNESGIEFFAPKPYLLVERNPAKDIAIKSTIIYLPDANNAKYAKLKWGFGSSDLQLSLTNGMINSYGITTDTKIPETITALTGALSVGGLLSSKSTDTEEEKEKEESFEKENEVKLSKAKAQVILSSVIKDLENLKTDLLTTNQKTKLATALENLKEVNKIISEAHDDLKPEISNQLVKIIEQLKTIKITSDTDEAKTFKSKWETLISEIVYVKEILKPAKQAIPPSFELYEIVMTNGKTKLIRASANTN